MFYPSVKAPVHSVKALIDLYDEQIELKDASEVVGYMSKTKLAKNTVIIIYLYSTADEETAAKTIAKNGVYAMMRYCYVFLGTFVILFVSGIVLDVVGHAGLRNEVDAFTCISLNAQPGY